MSTLLLRFGRQSGPPCPECHRRALRHVLIQERGLHYKWQLVLRCDSCHYDAVADELQMIVDPDELTPAAELHEAYERGWQDGYTFAEKARDKQELDTEINPDPPEAAA